jgi:hypothetical protein
VRASWRNDVVWYAVDEESKKQRLVDYITDQKSNIDIYRKVFEFDIMERRHKSEVNVKRLMKLQTAVYNRDIIFTANLLVQIFLTTSHVVNSSDWQEYSGSCYCVVCLI